MTKLPLAAVTAVLLAQAAALPVLAQAAGLTFEQVQRKYRKMSPVFIEKCDKNGDGVFTKPEMQCVAGIYQAMYIED